MLLERHHKKVVRRWYRRRRSERRGPRRKLGLMRGYGVCPGGDGGSSTHLRSEVRRGRTAMLDFNLEELGDSVSYIYIKKRAR